MNMNCSNKERPILFSGPMVQAILDGRKTQTRRLLKNQPGKFVHIEHDSVKGWQYWWDVGTSGMTDVRQEYAPLKCPYGAPGDRLWVRETFCPRSNGALLLEKVQRPFYKSTDGQGDTVKPKVWPWRPSIHMPRWASRLTLEITEIRVQRLQEISEEDAKAEGLVKSEHDHGTYWGIAHADVWETDPRKTFTRLWELINGPGSWDANTWVWCVSFKKVQP